MVNHEAKAKCISGGLYFADPARPAFLSKLLAEGLPAALAVIASILPAALWWGASQARGRSRSTPPVAAELVRANARIAHLACHDPLTELPNRRGFVEALARSVERARREGGPLAVLVLDLDEFGDVNAVMGQPMGDRLLQAVAKRLRASVRRTDILARLGGDEFAVILEGGESSALGEGHRAGAAERRRAMSAEGSGAAGAAAGACVAKTLLRALGDPLVVDGAEIVSGATIGIAAWDIEAPSAEALLSQAEIALHHAKAERPGAWRLFRQTMETETRDRVTMVRELRQAIGGDQLMLVYQPQVDIVTGRIVGLEALARWRHPTRGLLGAGDFVPAAEAHGLIAPLGLWVVRDACRQLRQWLDAGLEPIPVAVNVSAIQFKLEHSLCDVVAGALDEFAVPASLLELELTESVLMETTPDHETVIARLRERGHKLAIDDFGSGYSSLDYLRRYPADRIKIDRSFIADLVASRGAQAIVDLVLGLGRALDIEVVVEGVETEAQLQRLEDCGARIAQGFYMAMPREPADMAAWLTSGRVEAWDGIAEVSRPAPDS